MKIDKIFIAFGIVLAIYGTIYFFVPWKPEIYICIDGMKTEDKAFHRQHNFNLQEGFQFDMKIEVLQGQITQWEADSLSEEYRKKVQQNNMENK